MSASQHQPETTPPMQGHAAIVTGASLGIGRSTALALGRAGANVLVNYRSHEEAAEEVVQQIKEAGSQAVKMAADVSDQMAVESLVARAQQEFGRLDYAVSNAAYSDREPYYDNNMEGFRRTIDVTMWGAYYLLRAATQQMIKNDNGGRIVIVSSPLAFVPAPESMAYNMAKAALQQMTKTAAIEVAHFGIRVNAIQPGWIDTPGERKFASEKELEQGAKNIPLKRMGRPDEIAEGIMFLCNPRVEYMTGSTILMDGGITLPWWELKKTADPE